MDSFIYGVLDKTDVIWSESPSGRFVLLDFRGSLLTTMKTLLCLFLLE